MKQKRQNFRLQIWLQYNNNNSDRRKLEKVERESERILKRNFIEMLRV